MTTGERGSAAIEALLVAPVLLLLVALLVGGGRLASAQAAIRAVAREAGRSAVTAPSPMEAVELAKVRASDVAAGYTLDLSRLRISLDTGTFERGSHLRVRVTYKVELSSLPAMGLLPTSTQVSASHVEPIDRYISR